MNYLNKLNIQFVPQAPSLRSQAVLLLYVPKASACWDGFSEQQHGRLPEGASSKCIQNINHNCQIHDPKKLHLCFFPVVNLFIYLWHQREFQKRNQEYRKYSKHQDSMKIEVLACYIIILNSSKLILRKMGIA